MLSVTHSHIGTVLKNDPSRGKILQVLKDDINRPLAAILTLNTIANTVGAAGMGAQALVVFPGSNAVAIASGVLTFCILIFSEIIPKTIGAIYWKSLTTPAALIIRVLMLITFPFVWLSNAFSARMAPKEEDKRVSREEIAAMAEMGEDEGSIDEQESDIIENLFRLKETYVDKILTPRSVIYALEDIRTVGEIMNSNSDLNFSRIPVFSENIDNIIGMVYKDTILETMAEDFFEKKIADIIVPVESVFERETVEAVLNKFTKKRSHMFIVKDEFGGTTGIVTLEDCIETLLGVEIMDESDKVADMRKLAKDQLRQKRKTEEKR